MTAQLEKLVSKSPPALPGPEISVIVPTLNECENIAPLVDKIAEALEGEVWEIVFVDDNSSDATRDAILEFARTDRRVRMLHRIDRRGLSSAVIEGMLSSSAPFLAVLDADMQHDERLLRDMLARLRGSDTDIVIGSRYVDGGGVGGWDTERQGMSRFATDLAKFTLHVSITDPMSGFFMIRREAFYGAVGRVSKRGYKVLLDLFASSPRPLTAVEIPYQFRSRIHGESKLDSLVLLEFVELLVDKTIGRYIPARFIMFAAVGSVGVAVHMASLALLLFAFRESFVAAQTVASVAAMTCNFFLNNWLTYRDMRLRGFWNILRGLLIFYVVCAAGLISNVGIASYMFNEASTWWIAAISGILVGAVWNYAVSTIFTWRARS